MRHNRSWFRSLWAIVAALAGVLALTEAVVGLLSVESAVAGSVSRMAVVMAAAICLAAARGRRDRSVPPVIIPVAAPATQPPSDTRQRTEQVLAAIAYFGNISAVLKEETVLVIEDTERNAVSLMEELKTVENGMEDLLAFFNAAESSERVRGVVGTTETKLARSQSLIADFRRERDSDAHNVQTAMDDIATVVSDLGRMIQMVRDLSKQTRMLSFNATIEAARAGAAGRGFAVVASEVKDLSMLSDRAAVQIGQGIEKLERVIQASLDTIVGQRIVREARGFDDISEAVSDLTDNLRQLFGSQRDTLKKVQYENEQLAHPIMRMIGAIQFQDVLKRRLQAIVHCFDKITKSIEDSAGRMAAADPGSPGAGAIVLHARLEEMVQFAVRELAQNRQSVPDHAQAETAGAAMEMF